jgi:hypothetical protein
VVEIVLGLGCQDVLAVLVLDLEAELLREFGALEDVDRRVVEHDQVEVLLLCHIY